MQVTGISGTVTDVDAGYQHACALTSDQKMYCWGENGDHQLGDRQTTDRSSAQLLTSFNGKNVTAIAAGSNYTCAVVDSAAWCWGDNTAQWLSTGGSGKTPEQVRPTTDFSNTAVTAIAAGQAHTCALAGSNAYCWGYGEDGQVGNGATNKNNPVSLVTSSWPAGSLLSSLTVGQASSCVLAAGKPYCWGANSGGQLGDNSTVSAKVPTPVTTGVLPAAASQIAAGTSHACAVASNVAYCWGTQTATDGRLGNNATATSLTPVAVQAIAGPPCSDGAALITPGRCSLKPNTDYWYRTTYTIDGGMTKSTAGVGITTG